MIFIFLGWDQSYTYRWLMYHPNLCLPITFLWLHYKLSENGINNHLIWFLKIFLSIESTKAQRNKTTICQNDSWQICQQMQRYKSWGNFKHPKTNIQIFCIIYQGINYWISFSTGMLPWHQSQGWSNKYIRKYDYNLSLSWWLS